MKPGYKTTEFWLTLLAMIVSTMIAAGVFGEGPILQGLGIVSAILAKLGYTASRGKAKLGESLGKSEPVPALKTAKSKAMLKK